MVAQVRGSAPQLVCTISLPVTDTPSSIGQENVRVIVMITSLVEAGKRKCEQYWPDLNKGTSYIADGSGPMVLVKCIEEKQLPAWTERDFKVERRNEGRPMLNRLSSFVLARVLISLPLDVVPSHRRYSGHLYYDPDALYDLA